MAHLPTRKVLTVNQTFEILVNRLEMQSWEEALTSVMPKRKFVGPDGETKVAKTIAPDTQTNGMALGGTEAKLGVSYCDNAWNTPEGHVREPVSNGCE